MPEWIVCPGCQLRHSRRADGTCPRCHQSVDAIPEAAPLEAAGEPHPGPAMTGLGSLAQSARGQQIKSARGTLIVIGLLTLLVNLFFFARAESDVQEAIDVEIKKLGPTFEVDPVKLAALKSEAVSTARLINGGAALLGIAFLVCAALVEKHPVPVTITSLVLYLGGSAVFMMLDPSSMARGAIFKIIILVSLFKSVQAALAAQKEGEAAAQAA
jgi:hypothetical protein